MTITLHLSPDVQRKLETLAIQNGQDIERVASDLFQQAVESVDGSGSEEMQAFPPNEKMLAILREIEESHKDRPSTNGLETDRLLREARAGAMFGYDPIE
jgi:hypothetical protein